MERGEEKKKSKIHYQLAWIYIFSRSQNEHIVFMHGIYCIPGTGMADQVKQEVQIL